MMILFLFYRLNDPLYDGQIRNCPFSIIRFHAINIAYENDYKTMMGYAGEMPRNSFAFEWCFDLSTAFLDILSQLGAKRVSPSCRHARIYYSRPLVSHDLF